MAIDPLRLTHLQQGQAIVDDNARPTTWFVRLFNDVLDAIQNSVNAVINAQNAAEAAQAAAAAAQTSADSAQGTADDALAAANGAVPKNAGPSYSAPSGTISRTAYATYAAPTISNPPTQAEVQAVANALQALSQHVGAIIVDLRFNGALKTP